MDKRLLKELVVESGHTEVADVEIDALFKTIDTNQNKLIDIDEFMAYLQVADKVKVTTEDHLTARDVCYSVRKAHAKINALDVFEMFRKLPSSFTPSFS